MYTTLDLRIDHKKQKMPRRKLVVPVIRLDGKGPILENEIRYGRLDYRLV